MAVWSLTKAAISTFVIIILFFAVLPAQANLYASMDLSSVDQIGQDTATFTMHMWAWWGVFLLALVWGATILNATRKDAYSESSQSEVEW